MLSCWNLKEFAWKSFGRKLWSLSGRLMAQSAQLSFYLILAIFPFILFTAALAGLILRQQDALHELLQHHLHAVAPGSVAELLDSALRQVSEGSTGGKLSFGLLFALWAASSGMGALVEALNMAYAVAESRRWWKQKLVSIGLTLGSLVMILLALVTFLYGPRLLDWIFQSVGIGQAVRPIWSIGQWLLFFVLLLFAFNVLYVLGPNVKHREWRWLMPGTVLGMLLWLGLSAGFKVYLMYFNRYSATYGSIGAVMILLIWLYLSGLAILVGGELNAALEQREEKLEQKEG